MSFLKRFCFLTATIPLLSPSHGAVLYNELFGRDLSNGETPPTVILGGGGANQIIGYLNPNNDRDDIFVLDGLTVGRQISLSYEHDGVSDLIPISYSISDGNAIDEIFNTGLLVNSGTNQKPLIFNIPSSGSLRIHLNIMDERETLKDPQIPLAKVPELPPGPLVNWTITISPHPVPEPSSALFMMISSMTMLLYRRR